MVLLNMLRHKINLYRYEQGQCSNQRRMERLPLKVQELKNHQGPAHSLLISRFSWDLSLSSIQEGFSLTCVLHSDTNDIFANKTFHCAGNMLSLSAVQRSYTHHPCLSYWHSFLPSWTGTAKELTNMTHNGPQTNPALQSYQGTSIDSLRNKVSAQKHK